MYALSHNRTGTRWPLSEFDAVVYDLDGVITQTASLHAAAWKELFDHFLADRENSGRPGKPFDIERDYRRYVDGKPRHDGIRAFLDSRHIQLPEGTPDDGGERDTVWGLGARKNALFHQLLRERGVQVYQPAVELLRRLRAAGLSTAIVSSSRNCERILQAARLSELFDTKVDGNDLERLQLAGKPAPDMFSEASARLRSDPQRCIGFEDAEAGVRAIRAAKYGLVVGVARGTDPERLRHYGADMVIDDFGQLQVTADGARAAASLPSAMQCLDRLPAHGRVALFLDYDGTLTPIVDEPDAARLSSSMRETLARLARCCTCAVISGRDLPDVRQRVGIEDMWYAGSHGFDIAGPGGQRHSYDGADALLPALSGAEKTLRGKLGSIPGCLVERKRFAIAVHFRKVARDNVESVREQVESVAGEHPELRLSHGKKIIELQPDVEWNKGKALEWLSEKLELNFQHYLHIYIGDDTTDEDAFRALQGRGIGIVVASGDEATAADYRLSDPEQVEQFLGKLRERIRGCAYE